ncbi:MAG: cadherin-like beta sandwich domain-containing protein [Chthoniobacteraceae bacterium]
MTYDGTPELTVGDFGQNRTVATPAAGTIVIMGTVNAASIRDRLNFTLPAGKTVTSGTLEITNYMAAPPAGGDITMPQPMTYSSSQSPPFRELSAITVDGNGTLPVSASTRCGAQMFSVGLEAASELGIFIDPMTGAPIGGGTTYGSASYIITLQIGDAATDSTLSDLTTPSGPLTPVFNGSASYAITVPNTTGTIRLRSPATSQNALVSGRVGSGAATEVDGLSDGYYSLAVGENVITLDVCAQNGSHGTYVVTVTRQQPPLAIVSLNRVGGAVSNAAMVSWTLTFDKPAEGVTSGNFSPAGAAASGASVGTPTTTDGGTTWTLPVSTGGSDGDLALVFANSTGMTIPPSTTLPFTGQSVTMDKTAPVISGNFAPLSVNAGDGIPDYTPQAMVNDANPGTLTQTPATGIFTANPQQITLTATDLAGNVGTLDFDVTVPSTDPVNTSLFAQGQPAPGRGTNGLPADALLASFGPPAIDDAGNVAFTAKWTSATGGKGSGLFTGTACVGIVGGPVPGVNGATYAGFSDPVIDAGQVVSIITLAGVPKAANSAILSSMVASFAAPEGAAPPVVQSVIARTGDVATGDGAKFKKFTSVEVRGGVIGFAAQLASSKATDLGVWVKDGANPLVLMLREGEKAGTRTIKSLTAFDSSPGSRGQGRGWLVIDRFPRVLARVLYTDKSQAAVSAALVNGIVYVASLIDGDTIIPPSLLVVCGLGLPAVNAAGHGATVAATASDRGPRPGVLVNLDERGYQRIAAVGDPTPEGGKTYGSLEHPVLAADGGVAFPARVVGNGPGASTLWWQSGGSRAMAPAEGNEPRGPTRGLTLLAQGGATDGGAPSDLPAGAQWKAFSSLAIAANRGPLFSATLVANKGGVTKATASGVWAMDYHGTLRTLFRTGDAIGAKTLKSFALLTPTVGNTGVTRSFNDAGQVVWLATFTDKTQAIILTDVP